MSSADARGPRRAPDPEITLDPGDWDEFRSIGHQVLDDMIDYLKTVRERPVWQSPPADVRERLAAPLPRNATPIERVYEQIQRDILPYPTGNIHPRFWGWVMGNGTPDGVLADLVTSTMNCHVSGYDQAASLVETQVIRWLAEIVDYPADASGLLVSGGTVANLLAVATARNTLSDYEIRAAGLDPQGRGRLRVYGSVETHSWAERACDLLGLGSDAFRAVPIDAGHRIRVDDLRAMIERDLTAGCRPLCVIGNAGTVGVGANDDFHALADVSATYDVWFHVDGAFGALAKLAPGYRHLVDGIERADSIALDLHKWGYLQYEIACVLVKDADAHKRAFSFSPTYLEKARGGIAVDPTDFAERGLQLSRSFRALRAWTAFQVHGADGIGRVIEQNIEQASYLAALVDDEPHLERMAPVAMNIVCFRFVEEGFPDDQLDRLNRELLVRVHESGVAVPSNAIIEGRFAIRVAITNHRSRHEDFDLLVSAICETGRQIASGMAAGGVE